MILHDMIDMNTLKDASSNKHKNQTAAVDEEFNSLVIQTLKTSISNFIENTYAYFIIMNEH